VVRHLKILISCIYLPLFWFAAVVKQLSGAAQSTKLVILYYHGVSQSQRTGFARQMDFLKRHALIVPADWRGGPIKGRVCAITFDDGFVSTVSNALPELEARQIPCTIFVPAGVMGNAAGWEMEQGADCGEIVANVDTIRKLPSPLVTIGSHTISHCHLSRVHPDIARAEVERSRTVLSTALSEDVRLISFPYGDYNRAVMDLCVDAGYDFMYSIEPLPVDVDAGHRVRGRVSVTPDDSLLEVYLKSAGGYSWMPMASAIKRRVMRT
jgi:peptidoglycan/xylan/chitin deacetylase (PgdA/CDA1 family)